VVVWHCGNGVGHINEVSLYRLRLVSTGMDDLLWTGISSPCVNSRPGQLSLLLSMGQEMSTGQNIVMLCGWEVKAGMASYILRES